LREISDVEELRKEVEDPLFFRSHYLVPRKCDTKFYFFIPLVKSPLPHYSCGSPAAIFNASVR